VLLHLLVGCCAHHGHAAEATESHRLISAGHCPHGHACPGRSSEAPAAPAEDEGCDESDCVFGLALKDVEVLPAAELVFFQTPILAQGVHHIVASSRQAPNCHDPPASGLPTHLLFQVMLN
jgi:hypothetical protein